MIELSKEKGWLFRITHIDNVSWVLRNGLHCRNSDSRDPNYRDIGNPDLIQKRHYRLLDVAPGGTLSDYIPFYFTPYSPMMLNIKTGYNGMKRTPMPEIAIIVACAHRLAAHGVQFVVADRHAYLMTATFVPGVAGLDLIDWKLLQSRDFKRDPNDPSKFERYQAEALIHEHLPVAAISSILCYGADQERLLSDWVSQAECGTRILKRPDCYF